MDWETYLAWHYNYGCVLVGVNTGAGKDLEKRLWDSAFGKEAIAAYQKFLTGQPLLEKPFSMDNPTYRIQAKIKQYVVVPQNMEGNPQAVFEVVLLPGGEVLSAKLKKSSGNAAYDTAIERAISRAQPLPVPNDTDLFQESFRELNLLFRPKD